MPDVTQGLSSGRAGSEPALAAREAYAPSSLGLTELPSYPLDVGRVLLHGNLLQGTFKAKKGPDVQ